MKEIANIIKEYRDIRKRVYEEATMPLGKNQAEHVQNKVLLRSRVTEVCNNADLRKYTPDNENAKVLVWRHIWGKIRYAGIKAVLANKEITDIHEVFDDYEGFQDPRWDFSSKGYHIDKDEAGEYVTDFLGRTGIFDGKTTVGNIPKLAKTVKLARSYSKHLECTDNTPLSFIQGDFKKDDWLDILNNLQAMGYTAHTTALHLMMDLGYFVLKPDIVLTRLFQQFGWYEGRLPENIAIDDLVGKGSYGTKYLYTKPLIFEATINLAREVIENLSRDDLEKDIGWVTDNPMREFDIFLVKAAQVPDPSYGIPTQLLKFNSA